MGRKREKKMKTEEEAKENRKSRGREGIREEMERRGKKRRKDERQGEKGRYRRGRGENKEEKRRNKKAKRRRKWGEDRKITELARVMPAGNHHLLGNIR